MDWEAKYRELVEELLRIPAETNICMCGSYCDQHGFGDGHSPVDQWDYYVRGLDEELKRIDAEAKGAQS